MSGGRGVVVTGAASGIGAAVARRFVRAGRSVACLDRDEAPLRELCRSLGPAAIPVLADISDAGQLSIARLTVLQSITGIDILVNNAGMNSGGDIGEATESAWRACLDVNLTGTFLVTRTFWPDFIVQQHGIIINMSSIMGLAGDRASIAYCTSKAGIIAMTQCMAIDGAAHGIRANCVSPGFVDTPPMRAALDSTANPKLAESIRQQVPIGRMATPEEIAGAVAFLAGDDAAYLTGTNLLVDGGATLGYRGSP